MKKSPFIYGTTVSEQAFTDRENEIRKLRDNLAGGVNTMVISPRRWGKSSLVEKVADMIRDKYSKTSVVARSAAGSGWRTHRVESGVGSGTVCQVSGRRFRL